MKLQKIAALTATVMVCSAVAGCGGAKPAETTAAPAETQTEAAAERMYLPERLSPSLRRTAGIRRTSP